jgi:aarF domain-containing kinase
MQYYAQLVANVPPSKFTLFASAITGRDYGKVVKGEMAGLQVPRSIEEVQRIRKGNVGGDIMLRLVDLLSQMPRIMLLLLKTNDLTRYKLKRKGANSGHWMIRYISSRQNGIFC